MKQKRKIVKILDEYNVIINAGLESGIKLKDKFEILDNDGSAVYDIDTNQILGKLDLVKATVEVTELYEKMCVCSSMKKKDNFYKYDLDSFNSVKLNMTFGNTSREKLNIDLKEVTGGKTKSNSKIVLGDLVRLA